MWGKVITNATKNIFPASEAIFAAVQYLISTAKAVSADFDRLEEFFEELSSYLTRLKVWESEIPQITELEEVMTEVFTSVLVLCGICTKYVRMRRLVKAFRALAGEDDELKSAFNQFRKTIQREQGIVRNSILAGVQHLKLGNKAVHKDVTETLVLTEGIETARLMILLSAQMGYTGT
ncbi:Goodbye domain containing protein [Pyrenophora tritici-repentis]|nr:Goodbye domain containing protein [Pyrenophora tritici-repentis]